MLFKWLILICVYTTLNIVVDVNGEIVKSEVVKNEIEKNKVIETEPPNNESSEMVFSCVVGAKKDDKSHSEATLRFKVPVSGIGENYVKSPKCYLDDRPWIIEVRKTEQALENGKKYKELDFYIKFENGDDSDWSCDVIGTLGIFSHKPERESFIKNFTIHLNRTTDGWGYSNFIGWEKLLDPNSGYVKDDAIILEAHIMPYCVFMDSKNKTQDSINKGELAQNEVEKNKEIKNESSEIPFSCAITLMEEDKRHTEGTLRMTVPVSSIGKSYVKSPTCRIDNLPWCLTFIQAEKTSEKGEKFKAIDYFIEIKKGVVSTNWSCEVMAHLSVVSQKPDAKLIAQNFTHIYNSSAKAWGYYNFIEWNKMVDPNNGYVKDDAVTFEAHIKPYCAYMDSTKETQYTENNKYRFDYEYYPEIDGWLKHNVVPETWEEARLKCHLEGAELASPLSDVLLKIMKTNIHINTWTGVHATFSKGDYFSVGGVSLLKMPAQWALGQPDNHENKEDCIVMRPDGTIADVLCNDVFPYFCYKKKTSSVMSFCGTLDPDYIYDYKMYSCYKFHNHAQTWRRAFMTCAAEGGHLAVMNTPTETQFLKEMFAKYPKEKIFAAHTSYKDEAFIGIYDYNDPGMWATLQDQPLSKLIDEGVVAWAEGQPSEEALDGPGRSCGALDRDGRLRAVWCQAHAPFICEKSPESLHVTDKH